MASPIFNYTFLLGHSVRRVEILSSSKPHLSIWKSFHASAFDSSTANASMRPGCCLPKRSPSLDIAPIVKYLITEGQPILTNGGYTTR